MLTRLDDQLKEWKNHFKTVLNRPPPVDPPPVQAAQLLNINTGPISIYEIKTALKNLKVTPNLRGATFTEIIFFRSYLS